MNGVDASNLFNGKSTSQVPSARVINSTGVSSSTGAGGVIQTLASVYLSIGNAIPTPAPETLSEVRVNASMYDATQGSTSGAHIDMSTASGTNTLARIGLLPSRHQTGSMPLRSSSTRTTTFRRTTRFRSCTATHLGGTVGGPIIKDKLFGFLSYQHIHVSDQEIGDSVLDVPVGLTR